MKTANKKISFYFKSYTAKHLLIALGLGLLLVSMGAGASSKKSPTANKALLTSSIKKKKNISLPSTHAAKTKKISSKVTTKTKKLAPTAKKTDKKTIAARLSRGNRSKTALQKVSYPLPRISGSVASRMGLKIGDDLGLSSSVAYVVDQDSGDILFHKNENAVLPIASITKLMTAVVVREAGLSLDEVLTITTEDVYNLRGTGSRLRTGDRMTRGDMLHLMLMSSENLAAQTLARNYPGGSGAFIQAMRSKARELGMRDTSFEESSGLSNNNRSSARDLSLLVDYAYWDPLLRKLSTAPGYEIALPGRVLQYTNSNGLIKRENWVIGIQKTGFISDAGRCLVMQAQVAGRNILMVFLDASSKSGRLNDAERVRDWVVNVMAGYASRNSGSSIKRPTSGQTSVSYY